MRLVLLNVSLHVLVIKSLQETQQPALEDWKCLRAGLVLTCLMAGLVLWPDLSQVRKCLRAGLVSTFAARDSRARITEVSHGRKCLGANYFIIVVHTQLS